MVVAAENEIIKCNALSLSCSLSVKVDAIPLSISSPFAVYVYAFPFSIAKPLLIKSHTVSLVGCHDVADYAKLLAWARCAGYKQGERMVRTV